MTRRSSQANIIDSSTDAGWGIIPPVCNDNDNRHWSAFYATPLGYVEMEARKWLRAKPDTWLTFIWQERVYMRHFDRFYSRSYAARLATEFARDVVQGRVTP